VSTEHLPTCPDRLLVQVINLDRSPDRLQRIAGRLKALGMTWERLAASDGRLLDLNDPALVDHAEFGRRHGKHPLAGELGCYLSHVRAIRRLLESKADVSLILEDDAQLLDSLPGVVSGLMQCCADWDLVKLSGVHRGHPKRLRSLGDQHDLVVMLTRCTTSGAYMINRHAAQILADRLLPMRIPFDHEFDRGWHWGLKVRYAKPYPVEHDQTVASTINVACAIPAVTPAAPATPSGPSLPHARSATNARFHWSRRLPAFGWRTRNEWARLRYGLKVWLKRA
jgi:glycosyl transferase family 25